MPRKIKSIKVNSEKAGTAYGIRVGYASAAAEEISGDAAISCGLPDGSLALILSDGMGKGIKAAAGSNLVVRRLRRNLKNGMSAATAIKEVNRYMINAKENSEEFATVDLTLIDKNNLKARFYKMGAAKSFIVRNGKVREIKGGCLPIGMISGLRLSHVSAKLLAGDIIIMVSDGITEADKEDIQAVWLRDFLCQKAASYTQNRDISGFSTRRAAACILEEALKHYDKKERDDLTAVVAVIAEKEM